MDSTYNREAALLDSYTTAQSSKKSGGVIKRIAAKLVDNDDCYTRDSNMGIEVIDMYDGGSDDDEDCSDGDDCLDIEQEEDLDDFESEYGAEDQEEEVEMIDEADTIEKFN